MDTAVFLNPVTGRIEVIPTEMIGVYVPYAEHLNLEQAARVAAIRDEEAAANLLDSATDSPLLSSGVDEGCGFDLLSVEPPSLR